jgi:Arc/MetJ family transcription regulator
MASNDAKIDDEGIAEMRTTMNLDDELVARAQELTGIRERNTLVRMALEALVAREAARRLARLGGTEPQLKDIPRRRSPAA